LWSPKLLLTFVSSFIAFVLATPFALFDWRTFIGDLTSHGTMFYSGGYWEHGVFYPFTSLITSIGPPLGYLALVSLVYVLIRRRSADLILASQPLFLGAFLMMFKVKEPQHMLIAFPALAILSALFLTEAVAWIVRRPVLQAIALGLATAVVIASPARASYQSSYLLSLPDTRTVAKDWIEKNVPFNSKLVMDSGKYYLSVYGPPLRMSRWTLEGFIARSKSPAEGTLARREGTRRVGYSGEAEYFRKQLQTLGDEPAYDIVQILHDPGSTKTDVLTMQEYIAMGVQYAIVSSKAQESYTPDSEQAAKHPDKAAKYRDFYQSLASHATLLKDFNPSADIAGPGLQIYKLQ
jgi:hypothetical protein